jgi:hypothetical protein
MKIKSSLMAPLLPERLRSLEALQRSYWKASTPPSESPRKEGRKEK